MNLSAHGRPALEARFWAHVDKSGPGGCWIWKAAKSIGGYGRFRTGSLANKTRRHEYAHRVAYQLCVGPIPGELQLDHLCRVRACVRPDHLEPVSCRENLLRGDTITAACAAKTHCPMGHAYAGANLLVWSDGQRRCRECRRATKRASYRRTKQAVSA